MNFSLNDEQVMLRDSCRRFMSERYTLEHWTKVAGDRGFNRENWRELASLGYLAIAQPEAYGGIGGAAELAIVCQEFGRGLLLEPYVGTAVYAAKLIAEGGSEQQKKSLLPAIARGDRIIAVAHGELGVTTDDAIATVAKKNGGTYVLSGKKSLVLAAPHADLFVVSARVAGDANGVTLFLVDSKQSGVSLGVAPMLDRSWCAEVTFDNVEVAADAVLGSVGAGGKALAEARRYATLAVCAEMVGIVDRALEITVEYTKVRQQFGAPLATFQVLRHKGADMAIDCEMARSTLMILLASFQDPENRDPDMTVAMAKAQLGDIGRRVCGQAIQMHGGMGMTAECGVGRYFARANVINSLFGQTDSQFETYARLLAREIKEGAAS